MKCLVYTIGPKDTLNKSFGRLRTNDMLLMPFVVSPSASLRTGLSNHERNQIFQRRPKPGKFILVDSGKAAF